MEMNFKFEAIYVSFENIFRGVEPKNQIYHQNNISLFSSIEIYLLNVSWFKLWVYIYVYITYMAIIYII